MSAAPRDPADPRRATGDDAEAILAEWYATYYSQVTATADGSFFHSYMHRAMERRFAVGDHFPRVLEVGGNRGEHIEFVQHGFEEYVLTDLREPDLIAALRSDSRIRTQACDVSQLPFAAAVFDRVIATCLLHHVPSPLAAAREMRRVAKPGGVITVLVPTDPGLAYRVGKALTSGRAARRAGLGDHHRLIGALDHPNHFGSIMQQLKYAFTGDEVSIDWRPWRVPSMSVNAFTVVDVRISAAPR